MGFFDDLKDLGGEVVDSVVDIFDGNEDAAQPQTPANPFRPKSTGNPFKLLNPAYKQRETEYEKPVWMTGGDQQSPTNSWNADYLDRMRKQQEEKLKDGTLADLFDDKNVTSVAAFDHVTKSGKQVKFGDVFDKGKLVGNLYDDGDTADADLMMAQIVGMSPEEMAQAGQDRNPEAYMRRAVEAIREKNNVAMPEAFSALAHQAKVDEKQESFQEGLKDDIATFFGGAAGGATIGSAFGPVGSLVGGLGGGIAAWLNRDALSEQAANAFVVSEQAWNDREGTRAGDIGTIAKQGAGLIGKSIAPFSNLVQGLGDEDRGNGIAAMAEEDRPAWLKPVDIVATIGDMGVTFGSRVGIGAYTGQMVAHTAGGVAELTLGGGERWDAHSGTFKNVYEGRDGEFSLGNGLAAWGSTGIDALQLATVRGVAQKIAGAKNEVGASLTALDRRAIAKAGGDPTKLRVEDVAGRRFFVDEAGTAVAKRRTLASFVPSEAVQGIAAGGAGRAAAAKATRAGKTTADDIYQASLALTRSGSPIKAAYVNAIGEGMEEGLQEALDSLSFDHDLNLQQIGEAAAYGAAGGLGMGLAMNFQTTRRPEDVLNPLAREQFERLNGPRTDDEWAEIYKNMSREDMRALIDTTLNDADKEILKRVFGATMYEQAGTLPSGQIVTALAAKAAETQADRMAGGAGVPGRGILRAGGASAQSSKLREKNGSIVIANGAYRDDTAALGYTSLANNYAQKAANLDRIVEGIQSQIDEATAVLEQQTEVGADTSAVEAAIEVLGRTKDTYAGMEPHLEKINKLMVNVGRAIESGDLQRMQSKVDEINQVLDQMYRSKNDSEAMAAAIFHLRPPFDNAGSFATAAPALDWEQVRDGENYTFSLDWASLDVKTADFDGDRITGTQSLVMSPEAFRKIQRGVTWISQDGGKTTYKVAGLGEDMARAITLFNVHKGLNTPSAQSVPEQYMREFVIAVKERYRLTNAQIAPFREHMISQILERENLEPLETMLEYVAQAEHPISLAMAEYAEVHNSNEASVLAGMYRSFVDDAVHDINVARAVAIPKEKREGASKAAAKARPNRKGASKEQQTQQAATLMATFYQLFPTQDPLRIGQLIRLSPGDYKDRSAMAADQVPLLREASAQLRALAKEKFDADSEAGLDKFDVSSRVHQMALDVAGGDPGAAFNLLTQDFSVALFDGKDRMVAPYGVSVAQAFTMAVVQELRANASGIIARNPDIDRKLRFLEQAAADTQSKNKSARAEGAALILHDALAAFRVSDVIGLSSSAGWHAYGLDAAGTIGKNVRLMMKLGPKDRAALKREMAEVTGIPDDMRRTYDSVTDIIVEFANTEYSIDEDTGKVNGRKGRRNKTASDRAFETREFVRKAAEAQGNPTSREGILKTLESENGQQILEGFIATTGVASFVTKDGKLALRSYFLDFFAEKDAKKAEVILWRNRAISALQQERAIQKSLTEKDKKVDNERSRLDDTLALYMAHLGALNPALLEEFEIKLGTADSRVELEEYINRNLYDFPMPVMMYESSAADFTPELRNGGWATGVDSFGSALSETRDLAERFNRRITEQEERIRENVAEAKNLQALPDNDIRVREFIAAFDAAKNVDAFKTLDPELMVEMAVNMQYIAKDANTKGGELGSIAALAVPQIRQLTQTGHVDPLQDTMNLLLNNLDIAILRQRPELIFTAASFTDEFGVRVKVPPLTTWQEARDAIAANSENSLAAIISEAILPRAYTHDFVSGVTSVAYRGPRTLTELLNSRYTLAYEQRGGTYTARANAAYAAELSAISQEIDPTAVAAMDRAVLMFAMPRILGARSALSRKQIMEVVLQVRHEVTTVLRQTGSLLLGGEGAKQNLDLLLNQFIRENSQAILEAQQDRATARNQLRFVEGVQELAIRAMNEEFDRSIVSATAAGMDNARVEELKAKIIAGATGPNQLSDEEFAEIRRELDTIEPSSTLVELFSAASTGNYMVLLEAAYGQEGKPRSAFTQSQKNAIEAYILNDESLSARVKDKDAQAALAYFLDPHNTTSAVPQWEVLSRIVISDIIQRDANGVPSQALQVFMTNKHLDPTFAPLLRELLGEGSTLRAAAVALAAKDQTPTDTDQWQHSLSKLLPLDGSIRWDQSIGAISSAMDSVFAPISAGLAATIHGNPAKTWNALAMASKPTISDEILTDELQTVQVKLGPAGVKITGTPSAAVEEMLLDGAIGRVLDSQGNVVDLTPMVIEGLKGPFQGITLKRLELALEERMPGEIFTIEYFHPMIRPGSARYANDLRFDGVVAYNSPRTPMGKSLIAQMIFNAQAITQKGTRFVLDAVKKKSPAMHRVKVTPFGNIDLTSEPDPTVYLGALTGEILSTNLGYSSQGPEWYRAVLKWATMRHFVRYSDGESVSVHAYYAQYRNDPAGTLARKPEMVAMSERTANTFYGETGTYGLQGYLPTNRPSYGQQQFSWDALTDLQKEVLENTAREPVSISQNDVVNRAALGRVNTGRTAEFNEAVNNYQDLLALYSERDKLTNRRQEHADDIKYSFKKAAKDQAEQTNILMQRDRQGSAMQAQPDSAHVSAPHPHKDSEYASKTSLRVVLRAVADSRSSVAADQFFEFVKPFGGATFGDVITLDLDSLIAGKLSALELRRMTQYLIDHKATVVVRGGLGTAERAEVLETLRVADYDARLAQAGTFVPKETMARYQLERSYVSAAMATSFTTPESRILTFWPEPGQPGIEGVQESQSFIWRESQKSSRVARNVLHKQDWSPSLSPVRLVDDLSVVRQLLETESIPDPTDTDTEYQGLTHDDAVENLLDRARDNMLPLDKEGQELKKGMFEVYVVHGGTLYEKPRYYLHRAGSKPVKPETIEAFLRTKDTFLVGPFETQPDQSFYEGTVMDAAAKGEDLLLVVETRQRWQGNKIVPLIGGNKAQTRTTPSNLEFVHETPLSPNMRIEYIEAYEDALKKISSQMMVDFRSTAEALGFDNMVIFYKAVYGEEPSDSAESIDNMDALRRQLRRFPKDESYAPEDAARDIDMIARGVLSDSQTSLLLSLLGIQVELDMDIAEQQVLAAALTYLRVPGTQLSQIENAGGFLEQLNSKDEGSLMLPYIFTRVYDFGDPRKLALATFDSKLPPNMHLNDNYTVTIDNPAGGDLTGYIGFQNAFTVGEPQGENFDPTLRQSLSFHDLKIAEAAVGAYFSNNYNFAGYEQMMETATAPIDRSITRLTMAEVGKQQPWYGIGVAQQSHVNRGFRRFQWFFHKIDLTNKGKESEAEVKRTEDRIRKIAQRLFNDSSGDSDHHVHALVRLILGRPKASDKSQEKASRIALSTVNLGLDAIEGNMDRGYSPLRRGAVSLMPVEIRNAIIRANTGDANTTRAGRWAPRIYDTKRRRLTDFATDADSFTKAFFDHALSDRDANNIEAFNDVMDAVYNQYKESASDVLSLPVSLKLVDDLKLMSLDPKAASVLDAALNDGKTLAQFAKENPGALATSLYRGTEVRLTPAAFQELTSSATIAQLMGSSVYNPENETATKEVLEYVEERLKSFARKKDIPFPTTMATRVRSDSGAEHNDNVSNSHVIMRNLLGLHAAKALATPALMLGALVDKQMRAEIAHARRMLTGEGVGFFSRRIADAVESNRRIGQLMYGAGFRVQLTENDRTVLKNILQNEATTSRMRSVVNETFTEYMDLNTQGIVAPIRWLLKVGSGLQDLGRGTKNKSMMQEYMLNAITYLVRTENLSPQLILASTQQDGTWISRMYPEAHQAAVNATLDWRGIQKTSMSSAVNVMVRPLTHNSNAGVNAVAQMTLAMPLMFQKYAANLFLTLTGFRAFDQLAAHMVRGRLVPEPLARLTKGVDGRELTEQERVINMDDVIGSLDAMDAVINMGVTHTILFTGGMVMGGLGISGEDEEERRRRRQAAAMGAVWLSDPRDIENDFRNAHALFLDKIPGLNQLLANDAGRAIADPHWILKPLTSPLLGMERFFETGDVRQLKWGFEDAITSMPLLNAITFNKALTMSEELSNSAQDAAASGNLGASDSAGFLTHLVGYYEHALFESSFLNALYAGFDDYDRDPYVMPLRDSDGTLQRDAEGNVRANRDQNLRSEGIDGRGLAMQTYVDDEGNVKEGYWAESSATTTSRILAENRLSYALISSLFTGLSGKGMNTRYNMAVKTREVDKPTLTLNETKAAVLSLYGNGAIDALRKGDKQTVEQKVALSFLDAEGNELLTHEGARAVINGLVGGSVTPAAASLQGVYIDFETRKKLQEEWLDDLVIEGMRLGLSEPQAKRRANKVWYGSSEIPGIADVLWSKDISYSKTQEFQQLNTTYMMGPDGNVWATGFSRQGLLGAMGLAPLQGLHTSADTHTGMDERMNVAGFGINNTGLRSLRPVNDSLDTPTDAEIGDAITKAIEDLDNKDYSGGFGFGGGGGGYAQRPVSDYGNLSRWTNQNWNPIVLRTPYANDIYAVRTDNIRTDTSPIRRERISSERGRLTPWQ